MSNRKLIIVLIVQSVLLAPFLIYALVQRTQAIKLQELAIQAEHQAQENEKRAIEAQRLAEEQAHLAHRQQEIANQERLRAEAALLECRKRK